MHLDEFKVRAELTFYGLMMITQICVNTASRYGLLPEGTRSWSKPMLTHQQWSPAEGDLAETALDVAHYKMNENYIFQIMVTSPRGQWVNAAWFLSNGAMA